MLSFVETQRSPGQKAGAITQLKTNPFASAFHAKNDAVTTAITKGALPTTTLKGVKEAFNGQRNLAQGFIKLNNVTMANEFIGRITTSLV